LIDANTMALALLGVDRAALPTLRIFDLVIDGSRDASQRAWARMLRDGAAPAACSLRRRDGEVRVVEPRAIPHIAPAHHLVILRDITEQRRLDETRATITRVVEAARDAIIG